MKSLRHSALGKELLKATLALLGFVVALVLILAGPLGWLLLAGLAVVLTRGYSSWQRDGNEKRRPQRTNCHDCGAPNPVENIECAHCGEPLVTEQR